MQGERFFASAWHASFSSRASKHAGSAGASQLTEKMVRQRTSRQSAVRQALVVTSSGTATIMLEAASLSTACCKVPEHTQSRRATPVNHHHCKQGFEDTVSPFCAGMHESLTSIRAKGPEDNPYQKIDNGAAKATEPLRPATRRGLHHSTQRLQHPQGPSAVPHLDHTTKKVPKAQYHYG